MLTGGRVWWVLTRFYENDHGATTGPCPTADLARPDLAATTLRIEHRSILRHTRNLDCFVLQVATRVLANEGPAAASIPTGRNWCGRINRGQRAPASSIDHRCCHRNPVSANRRAAGRDREDSDKRSALASPTGVRVVITLPTNPDIFLFSQPTDMRKSFCS